MGGLGFRGSWMSSTGWEKSHFGGHQRLIWDYPFVNVPDDLKFKTASGVDVDLQHYSAEKLLKIFFMTAKEQNLALEMFDPNSAEMVMKESGYAWNKKEEPKIKLTATTESIKSALPVIMEAEPELAPLFANYSDFIINSQFEILVDIPEGAMGEGQDGEGKEGEKGNATCDKGMSGEGEGEGESGDEEGSGKGSKGSNEEGEKGDEKGQEGSQSGKGPQKEEQRTAEQQAKDAAETAKGEAEQRRKMAKDIVNKYGIQLFKEMVQKVIDDLRKHIAQKNGYNSTAITTTYGGHDPRFKIVQPKTSPTQIKTPESQSAEMLLKMLDISWDSDKDVVKSLRMGKIDITKIAEVPAGNVAIYQREMEEQSTKPFSVCILVDESGSMGRVREGSTEWCYDPDTDMHFEGMNKATASYHLIKSLYHAFSQIMSPDKLFVYGHTGDNCEKGGPNIYTYHDPYSPNFLTTIEDMKDRRKGNNYDGPVVEAIHRKVREITDDRIIFIVLSDGQPAGSGYGGKIAIDDFKRIVERAKRDEFVTCGIFVQYAGAKEMYQYSTKINNMKEMPKKVSHLLNKVVKTEFQ